jgi:hypothetical protein
MYKYINKEDEQCKPLLSTFDGANNNNNINYSTVDSDYNAQHLNSDKIKPASKAPSTNSEGTTVDYETKYKLPVLLTQSGWKTLFQHCSTTVYLENKGAVARDHLGNNQNLLKIRFELSLIPYIDHVILFLPFCFFHCIYTSYASENLLHMNYPFFNLNS